MEAKPNEIEWVQSARKALDWMIELITVPEWHRRRKAVADYFRSINRQLAEGVDPDSEFGRKGFAPLAVYEDRMGWYMYLIESIFERSGNDEPWQTNRIAPFFALIGRYLDEIKKMAGIKGRANSLLNPKNKQPDNTLYELAVAILYHRNGWQVEFLEERRNTKTPDMRVTKGAKTYWVECKRFARVTDYAEQERQAWGKRVFHLLHAMELYGPSAYIEVVFKVPVEDLEEVQLGAAVWACLKGGLIKMGETLQHELLDITIKPLDLDRINRILKDSPTRLGSPLMLQILAGDYDMHGQYTQRLNVASYELLAPDNELYVLNKFISRLHGAVVVKWDCVAEKSLELKFKDIKKRLSEAVSQIPDEGDGIIHIGYETVSGPAVELRRHGSIKKDDPVFQFCGQTDTGDTL
jgi:hypothetical protein